MKYQQQEKTRYNNNEYLNMPSIDFYLPKQRDLITENQDEVDWEVVKTICEKHGFNFTIINGTFGKRWVGEKLGYDSEVVIYKKLDIDTIEFAELEKNKQYEKIWEISHKYEPIMLKLHDCIHELDEETELVFATAYSGNCGLFGSHDVHRKTYSFGNYIDSWKSIVNQWDTMIYDTTSKLKKGVYLLMTSRWLKTYPNE